MLNIQTPAARNTDPATSHEAEALHNASGDRFTQQKRVAECVRDTPGFTSRELALWHGFDRYMVARRLPECETAGTVERGPARRCSRGRGRAVTWWPVPVQDRFSY